MRMPKTVLHFNGAFFSFFYNLLPCLRIQQKPQEENCCMPHLLFFYSSPFSLSWDFLSFWDLDLLCPGYLNTEPHLSSQPILLPRELYICILSEIVAQKFLQIKVVHRELDLSWKNSLLFKILGFVALGAFLVLWFLST